MMELMKKGELDEKKIRKKLDSFLTKNIDRKLFALPKSAKKLEDLTDWERVDSLSESEIETNALSDPDNQPLSPDTLKNIWRLKRK